MATLASLPHTYTIALDNRFTTEQIDAFVSSGKPNFVYGSLMLPSIMANVVRSDEVDIASAMTQAVALGHQRYAVKGADFPAVMASKDPSHSVEGIVVFGLNHEQRTFLDSFESGLYNEKTVQVEIALVGGDKRIIDAAIYMWGGERDDLYEVEEVIWTVDNFIQSDSYECWSA